GMARGELGEGLAGSTADADPVLRRGFEEIEASRRRDLQFGQQRAAQPEADGARMQQLGGHGETVRGRPRTGFKTGSGNAAAGARAAALAFAALAFLRGLVAVLVPRRLLGGVVDVVFVLVDEAVS